MICITSHFAKLSSDYLFPKIQKIVDEFKFLHPTHNLLDLGIGDVPGPLPKAIAKALQEASLELTKKESFKGYGPSSGYSFLKKVIKENCYQNLPIDFEEIFIGTGIKDDIAFIQQLFSSSTKIALCNPTYPVYLDSNILAGRTSFPNEHGFYENIEYLNCLPENDFAPEFPKSCVQLIYLCSPNNPTGTALNFEELKKWVDYAKKHHAIILYDGAYESFITDKKLPKSIYEIEGADEVAVELRSFSKAALFTGIRCSYLVLPKKIKGKLNNETISLFDVYQKMINIKKGGVSYPIQKAAEATFSKEAKEELNEWFDLVKENAINLIEACTKCGYNVYGGKNSPYLFVKSEKFNTSFDFFQYLLEKKSIISIPGSGFGTCGEGFIRLSALTSYDVNQQALKNLCE